MSDLLQWLDYGGVMLIPIGVASLVGLALFVARWRAHRTPRVIPEEVRRSVLEAVEVQNWERARGVCGDDDSTLARVFLEGLRFRSADRGEVRAAMEDVGRRELNRLERFVGAIGALASVTPLMGLLGTVMGMIKVFQGVVQEAGSDGLVDATALAGGIWEALVTTAVGLAVAIPLYLGYRYLLGRLDALSVQLEETASELLDRLAPPPSPKDGEQRNESSGRLEVPGAEPNGQTDDAERLAAEGA